MKKCDFVKGPVNHEHLKDSALCSKVTTMVRYPTYNLEMEAYVSTLCNFCQTERFQLAVFKNTVIWNDSGKQKNIEYKSKLTCSKWR